MINLRTLAIFIVALFAPVIVRAENIDELMNFSKKKEDALIVKAVNADIFVLENGQRIKLIGVESAGRPPRKYVKYDSHGKPIEEPPDSQIIIPIDEQALAYAQNLLEGKKVKLEYDIESRSNDGYRYAYVFLLNGQMANVELLRMGFVQLKLIPPNLKYAEELRKAYQEAKREKRGLESD